MKRYSHLLALGAATLILGVSVSPVSAQQGGGRGNFDPEQMRQRMTERMKERLEVTNDDEWKIIETRIEKVLLAQREARGGGMAAFGAFGGGLGGRRGGGPQGDNGDGGRGRGGRGPGGEPSPEVEALQKALDAKASNDELKTKMAKVREATKEKEANLAKAQDDLRKVLSVRQEANAVLMGLLR